MKNFPVVCLKGPIPENIFVYLKEIKDEISLFTLVNKNLKPSSKVNCFFQKAKTFL